MDGSRHLCRRADPQSDRRKLRPGHSYLLWRERDLTLSALLFPRIRLNGEAEQLITVLAIKAHRSGAQR